MLYILGGAPRSGKTLLSRRMLAEKGIAHFPVDALVGMLAYAMPELEVHHSQEFIIKSEKVGKLTKHLFGFFVAQNEPYLLEGDAILPSQVNEFVLEHADTKACFTGYPEITPEQKLRDLREFGEGQKDWTNNESDEALLWMLERAIRFSAYLKKECSLYGIPFFDSSVDFKKAFNDAFAYLNAPHQ
jgi:hypothetical protein